MVSLTFSKICEDLPASLGPRFELLKPLRQILPEQPYLLWAATDRFLERPVALKIINPLRKSSGLLKAFLVEDRFLKLLSGHPQVIERLDRLAVDFASFKTWALVLELGEMDLRAYLADKPPLADALAIFAQCLCLVCQLHELGICHRDIKPDNFVCLADGRIKLIDFDLAIDLQGRVGEPAFHHAHPIGTGAYSPPELFCGLGINPYNYLTADAFALGALMFELLAGTMLTREIYDYRFWETTAQLFSTLPTYQRKLEMYLKLLPVLEKKLVMPELSLSSNIPDDLIIDLKRIFSELTKLDFRQRCTDLNSIIFKLVNCLNNLDEKKANSYVS